MNNLLHIQILSPNSEMFELKADKLSFQSDNSINDLLGDDIAELMQRLKLGKDNSAAKPLDKKELYRVMLEPGMSNIMTFLAKGKSIELFSNNSTKSIKLQSDGYLFAEKNEQGNKVLLFVNNYIME